MMRRFVLASAFAAILPACTVGPDYHPPAMTVPKQWTEASPNTTTRDAEALAQWWQGFQDARLTALVERALRDNLDGKAAEAFARTALSRTGCDDHGDGTCGPRLAVGSASVFIGRPSRSRPCASAMRQPVR